MDSEDKIIDMLDNMQKGIDSMQDKLDATQDDIELIKIQLKEHGDILSALKTASEFQKAETDGIKMETARISGDVKALDIKVLTEKIDAMHKDINEMKETDKSLLEMYGEHEAQFRWVRRKLI